MPSRYLFSRHLPSTTLWLIRGLVIATLAVVTGQPWAVEPAASAEIKPAPVYFESDIRPILKAHCFHCHGEDGVTKDDIDLRLVRSMRAAKVIDAQHPEKSKILEACVAGEMPKEGKPLPPHEIDVLRRWLVQGAPTKRAEPDKAPDFLITEAEASHWAFQPVRAVAVPAGDQAHPVDAFVAAKLAEKKLTFAPPADRVSLIRRATFDLHGLPPTPEETDAFVRDPSPQAWATVIDRLLASPAYGERWGRHWLDVVGYADSNGGPRDSVREHSWHYRDYVVRAFSDDKPFDQFIREQLAGDELAGVTAEQEGKVVEQPPKWDLIAATGFLRMTPDTTGDDPANAQQAREDVLTNTVRIMGSSLLGLTLQCAQCHDHRFDPVSHVDYYRIRALIEPVYDPANWRTPTQRQYAAYTADEQAANREIEAKAVVVDGERQALIDRVYDKYLEERMAKIADDAIKQQVRVAWHKPEKNRTADEQALLVQYDCNFSKADQLRFLPNREVEEEQRVQFQVRAAAIRATKLSRVLMAASERPSAVPTTRRFHRGNFKQPKEEVGPGDLQVFAQPTPIAAKDPARSTTGRRLAYAAWLTSGQHPTLARVLINRFWMHHVGHGFVITPEDFGMRTARPLHSDLLDYLAQRFVSSGWKLKEFQRLVMTSRTYQQASRNPAAEQVDADNAYLARMPLRRIEAEVVRDALLAVSGKLDRRVGGAPMIVARNPAGGIVLGKELVNASNNVVHTVVPLGDDANRRSLYVQVRRDRQLSVLQAFDMPTMAPNCGARVCSTVAPQSLMMLNDTFVIEQSLMTAKRILGEWTTLPAGKEPATSVAWQVERMWQLAYGAAPTAQELTSVSDALTQELKRQDAIHPEAPAKDAKPDSFTALIAASDARTRALASLCQVVFASNRFLYAP